MNRLRKGDRGLLDSDEDDDDYGGNGSKDYEKRALINQQDLGDDDIDLFSANPYEIRQRLSKNNNELHELNPINNGLSSSSRKQRDLISEPIVEYTYYDIRPGDTLHSICLRYGCPLAQVKRLNGLMNDQEFYGLKRIKLPLGKFGLLEDVLTTLQQTGGNHNILSPDTNLTQDTNNRQKIVISPGSALSISTYPTTGAKFKPLLSPGYSSDRINELNRFPRNGLTNNGGGESASSSDTRPQHSHSFSSLSDFASTKINNNYNYHNNNNNNNNSPEPIYVDTRQLQRHAFIKTHHFDLETENHETIVDYIPSQDNVEKVFEDLDYHVEKAKVAAESYDQRASEIVNQIDINGSLSSTSFVASGQRISKIPELFFCNENFGLSYKKLLVFIFIVCLFVPLIYINQAKIVTT